MPQCLRVCVSKTKQSSPHVKIMRGLAQIALQEPSAGCAGGEFPSHSEYSYLWLCMAKMARVEDIGISSPAVIQAMT